MGSTKVEAPKARNYGNEMRDTLQAQIDLMPQLMAAERRFGPMQADLRMGIAESISPRLLSLYENQINPALSRMDAAASRRQRAADISDFEELGPRATQAMLDADPERAKLLGRLTDQADQELSLGGKLSAFEKRQIEQDVMASRSATGMAYGPSTSSYLPLAQQQGRQQRLRDRQSFAGKVAGMRTQMLGDPFLQITGRSSRVNHGSGGGIFGQTQGLGTQLFNPESNYAGGLYNANAQAQLAARSATASNRAALGAGFMGMIGGIGGGFASR